MVAKHWAGVFIKLSVILHMLMSYLHCTCTYPSDHNQLRAHNFIWRGRIAPFSGVHRFIFTDIKHHLPSYSAVIQFCTIHLSNWFISLPPQKYCVVNEFYPLASSSRWFMSLLSCKGPGVALCRSLLVTSPHSENRPLAPTLCLLPRYLSRRKPPRLSYDTLVSKILTLFKIFFHSLLLPWARGLFSASLLITLSPP